jgi:hypothetical protein
MKGHDSLPSHSPNSLYFFHYFHSQRDFVWPREKDAWVAKIYIVQEIVEMRAQPSFKASFLIWVSSMENFGD